MNVVSKVGLFLALSATAACGVAADNSMAGFCRRAEKGERLTVAFYGGSLTWGANASDPNRTSWRARLSERLVERFPNAHFKFVDAAIGGTTSQLGIFRLDRDVIAYRPDLMFIEWTCNDGYDATNDVRSSSYEGSIRRFLSARPDGVVAQVILPTKEMIVRAAESPRRAERLALGKAYGLATADVLGELRVRQRAGKLDLEAMWPTELVDTIHPFDPGYALYADVIWEQLFANPSESAMSVPEKALAPETYRKVVRRRLSEAPQLPQGWRNGFCETRAGTFDFMCSRWQDGETIATNNTPFKVKFRGEVLLLFGESVVTGGNVEAWVDGKKVSATSGSWFAKMFPPSAYLSWGIGKLFDGAVEHELEIRPNLKPGEQLKIESICVAGENAASVDWIPLP
jgi:lysophospholipase L1-like esterase